MTARTELKNYWERAIVVTGPGYEQMPLAVQKVLTSLSLTYGTSEFAIMGGDSPVYANRRHTRMDTARVFAELSKTVVSMLRLEGAKLTLNDATLREHSVYMKLVQTVDSNGA